DFKNLFYPRPVDALWGVGESTKKALAKIGVRTVGDLAGKKEKELSAYFGKNGEGLYVISKGYDNTEVFSHENQPHDKSMSHETTLAADLSEIEKIYSTLLWLSDKVARRLRKYNYWGRTVSVKVRSSDFRTITRDKTLSSPTDQCRVIYGTARKLIPRDYGPRIKVRLLGVRVSHLERKNEEVQLSLLDDFSKRKLAETSKAVDSIRNRFGESVLVLGGTRL
ncbi:MAG: DNA polymerase IV, partial [Candidatus Zixiibacteriota bacterium]